MGWLMMAPLARPRRAQRQEVVRKVATKSRRPSDVGVAAGGSRRPMLLIFATAAQLRVQYRHIGLPGDGAGGREQRLPLVEITYATSNGPRRAWAELPFGCLRIVPQVVRQLAGASGAISRFLIF